MAKGPDSTVTTSGGRTGRRRRRRSPTARAEPAEPRRRRDRRGTQGSPPRGSLPAVDEGDGARGHTLGWGDSSRTAASCTPATNGAQPIYSADTGRRPAPRSTATRSTHSTSSVGSSRTRRSIEWREHGTLELAYAASHVMASAHAPAASPRSRWSPRPPARPNPRRDRQRRLSRRARRRRRRLLHPALLADRRRCSPSARPP